ncbi:MAG: hypothetical protein WCW64_03625 [Phycisphaerae bacterium]|jgi:Spy/CpxP family protein refolding chaperone
MTTKLINKLMVVILAILATVVFTMSSQQAFGNDDPNAKSTRATTEDANGHGGMRGGFKDRVEELNEELGLTEQQKEGIKPIFENEKKDLRAVMIDKSLTKEQKWKKIDAILQRTKEQLSKILTPEQQKKYAEMRADVHGGGPEFAERHIERISEKLGLTAQQKKDITPIIESEMKEMRAVVSNEAFTKEQKWKKIDAIHQTTKEQLSKILTPEQQKKYAEMEDHTNERAADHSGEGDKNCQRTPADSNSK